MFKGNVFKSGARLTIMTILAIIVVIILNVLASIIPAKFTHIDTTKEKMFTMSKQTVDTLARLDESVTVYHLCAGGIEDENISELLKKYASENQNITISVKDTTLYPAFSTTYTDDKLSDNSLIIESDKRYKVVDFYDIYTASSEEYAYYGYYDIFNGESQLTSAIDYVTSESLPKICMLSGHGELELAEDIISSIQSQNFVLEHLSLAGLDSIPDDVDCLMILSPKRDISESDKNIVLEFMKNGGRLIITSDYVTEKRPIFDELLNHYGIEIVDGIVFEGDSRSHVPQYPYFVYPSLKTHDVTEPIISENLKLLFPLAQGIKQSDNTRETLEITELITTTESSYSKLDISSEDLSKTDEDISGPFALAYAVTEDNSKLVMFSSSQFLDSNINSMVAGANSDLFLNSIAWACEKENSITIHSKNMHSTSVAVPDVASKIVFMLIVVFIPLIFIAIAIVITKARKSK